MSPKTTLIGCWGSVPIKSRHVFIAGSALFSLTAHLPNYDVFGVAQTHFLVLLCRFSDMHNIKTQSVSGQHLSFLEKHGLGPRAEQEKNKQAVLLQ